ncbi:MAG: ATP-grasp fold amidoligase family protein [Rhodospirillaceae bacterium]|nr:ATP-grasp fold amidoligase family protein [Rhodospirillaceae bacterium]
MATRKLLRQFLPKNRWGDRIYGRHSFRKRLGRDPVYPPVKFNDHLFAWKTSGACYDPLIQFVTDKEYAKLYIAAIVGEEYVTETYRILQRKKELKELNLDRFPCILKPTHSSGQIMVCGDDSAPLDRTELEKWFEIDYYYSKREPNYRHLSPKIIVEEFFSEDGHTIPKDYKIFCVHGIPKFIQVDGDRFSGHSRNLYDLSWNRIPAVYVYPNRKRDDPRPELLDMMLDAARKLSAAFSFVRVDFYATKTEIRVGELTFFPESASGKLEPEEAENALGAYFSD